MDTQANMVLQYIKDFGSIDPMQALSDLGVYRLGARIFDLRKDGYNIVSQKETKKNRYGRTVSYARYTMGA